jgi:hypothetical protein
MTDIVERLQKGLSADGIQAHKEALILLPEAADEIERLRAEVAALREFFLWVFEDFPESFPDGFAMQDEAERLGLLVDAKPKEPCGEDCACVEYYSQQEWGDGEVKCLRRAAWIDAAREGK